MNVMLPHDFAKIIIFTKNFKKNKKRISYGYDFRLFLIKNQFITPYPAPK